MSGMENGDDVEYGENEDEEEIEQLGRAKRRRINEPQPVCLAYNLIDLFSILVNLISIKFRIYAMSQ